MKFAVNLKTLRHDAGLTQRSLAEKSGLTRSAISMYESGLREPNFEDLDSLADALDVDIGSLVGSKAGRGSYPRHGMSISDLVPGLKKSERVLLAKVSKEEALIVRAYRAANPAVQLEVKRLLRVKASGGTASKTKIGVRKVED